MEHCILQNNAINIYESYFDEEENMTPVYEKYHYKTLNVFRDPLKNRRSVQHISWSPDGGTHLAASYCNLAFQQSLNVDTSSYVWDVGMEKIRPNFVMFITYILFKELHL